MIHWIESNWMGEALFVVLFGGQALYGAIKKRRRVGRFAGGRDDG